MARQSSERLDDNGLPIGAYGRVLNDEYETLDRHELLKKCREQRLMLDRYDLERTAFIEHIQRLRGEEPGNQEDAPPRVTRRRLKLP